MSGFDKLARIYRWAEYASFGPFLMRCRLALLPELKDCQHALVLGDGDGRFTVRALKTYPQLRITAIDISPAMLRTMERRAKTANVQDRLTAHCADITTLSSLPVAETVVTHFFLDCLTTDQVRALTQQVSARRWIVSEFDESPGAPARVLIRGLYAAFVLAAGLRVQTMPAWREALTTAGFRPAQQHRFLHGLLISECWKLA